MGKNDFLSPKAIANRIKSKGLQKLRWYCQMCQKQCRDENGFKCHLTSESHKRQMQVFGEAPERVIEGYSEEFENTFMEHLRRSHPFSRVMAKNVYNEYIADKHHIHMNSTKWYTLTEFVQHLSKTGQVRADLTDKGWFISVIQPDPEEKLAEERRHKRDRAEREGEERQRELLEAQIQRAKAATADEGPTEGTELQRDEEGKPLQIAFGGAPRAAAKEASAAAFPSAKGFRLDDEAPHNSAAPREEQGRKRSKAEELMEKDKAAKKAKLEREKALSAASKAQQGVAGKSSNGRQDAPWLHPGITVKVLSKELKEHGYYKKKGLVEKLASKYVAQIAMLDSGDVLQVDQAQLETVLPALGGTVLVVRGESEGARGELVEIDEKNFRAQFLLKNGREKWFDYEDICKVSAGSRVQALKGHPI